MLTVMVTFVQAKFVLAIFVHIGNVLAVTDPILTKMFAPDILGALYFFCTKTFLQFFFTNVVCLNTFLDTKIFGDENFLDPKLFEHKIFCDIFLFTISMAILGKSMGFDTKAT